MNLYWMRMGGPFIFDKADSPAGMKYGMTSNGAGSYKDRVGRLLY